MAMQERITHEKYAKIGGPVYSAIRCECAACGYWFTRIPRRSDG
jgi:ribosomal protein L37E